VWASRWAGRPVEPRPDRCPGASLAAVAGIALLLLGGMACRRENPTIARAAAAAAASTATAVAVAALPTPTATPSAAAAGQATAAPAGGQAKPGQGARRAKIAGGNLGVAASGIGAGLQIWSKPGGVMAGGSTLVGTVPDGAAVEVVAEEQFVGQRYFHVRGAGAEGWIEARFVQLEG
jgi:hypothetical protein